VNPTFEPKPSLPDRGAVPAILFHLQKENSQPTRVPAAQQLLFPSSVRAICDELGLNWWTVVKLYEDGWLSFSPETITRLDEAQEAELRFVGSLVVAGCDRMMLAVLLGELRKPYAYDVRKLYFDWASRKWRVLPDPREHPEAVFADWLDTLIQKGDASSLSGIEELAQEALSRVRVRLPERTQPELPHRSWSETDDGEQVQG
jgi:hypothetical protein